MKIKMWISDGCYGGVNAIEETMVVDDDLTEKEIESKVQIWVDAYADYYGTDAGWEKLFEGEVGE